jgi:hypothetical protein
MSVPFAKFFSRPLSVASVALLMHVGGASAANSAVDLQQQMKELLAGTITHSAPGSEPRGDRSAGPTVDTQESVKQVLLGASNPRIADTDATNRPESRALSSDSKGSPSPLVRSDTQAAVRRVLLGQTNPAASGS